MEGDGTTVRYARTRVVMRREWAILCEVEGMALWVPRGELRSTDLEGEGDHGTLEVSRRFAQRHRLP